MIETDNLRLVTVERVHVEALSRDKRELAPILGVTVPDGWPHFPEAFPSRPTDPAAPSGLQATGQGTSLSIRKVARWSATAGSWVGPTTRVLWRSGTRSPPNIGTAGSLPRRRGP